MNTPRIFSVILICIGSAVASFGQTGEKREPYILKIAGMKHFLETYVKERNAELDRLTENYHQALEREFEKAADSGNLPLAKSINTEMEAATDFRNQLSQTDNNLLTEVKQFSELAKLPADSPENITDLRKVWTNRKDEIFKNRFGSLVERMDKYVLMLTKNRDLTNAQVVADFRSSLNDEMKPRLKAEQTEAPEIKTTGKFEAILPVKIENPKRKSGYSADHRAMAEKYYSVEGSKTHGKLQLSFTDPRLGDHKHPLEEWHLVIHTAKNPYAGTNDEVTVKISGRTAGKISKLASGKQVKIPLRVGRSTEVKNPVIEISSNDKDGIYIDKNESLRPRLMVKFK